MSKSSLQQVVGFWDFQFKNFRLLGFESLDFTSQSRAPSIPPSSPLHRQLFIHLITKFLTDKTLANERDVFL